MSLWGREEFGDGQKKRWHRSAGVESNSRRRGAETEGGSERLCLDRTGQRLGKGCVVDVDGPLQRLSGTLHAYDLGERVCGKAIRAENSNQ